MTDATLNRFMTETTNRVGRIAPWAVKDGRFTRTAHFVGLSLAGFLIPLILLDRWLGVSDFVGEGPVGAAAFLALFGMIAIGIGLMTLIFYSNNSGLDESVYTAHIVKNGQDEEGSDAKNGNS